MKLRRGFDYFGGKSLRVYPDAIRYEAEADSSYYAYSDGTRGVWRDKRVEEGKPLPVGVWTYSEKQSPYVYVRFRKEDG